MYSAVASCYGSYLPYKRYVFGYIYSELQSETNVNNIPDNCLNSLNNSGFSIAYQDSYVQFVAIVKIQYHCMRRQNVLILPF